MAARKTTARKPTARKRAASKRAAPKPDVSADTSHELVVRGDDLYIVPAKDTETNGAK